MLGAAGPSNRDLDTIQSHMARASNTTALLLAQDVVALSRSELRWELATIAQRDIPAARFANALLDNIAGFSGHNSARAQEDDITLLVLDFQ